MFINYDVGRIPNDESINYNNRLLAEVKPEDKLNNDSGTCPERARIVSP